MREHQISRDVFINLPADEIAAITKKMGKPRVGIFVPDGNRRMTLAFSSYHPQSDEFYNENARLTTSYFLENLTIFFNHGLETLFVPLISGNVLERNEKYQQITFRRGLQTILEDEQWLNFYQENDIQVHFYGDLSQLKKKDDFVPVVNWIDHVKQATEKNRSKHLFYGFLSPQKYGNELTRLGIEFYKKNSRIPTHQEQVLHYYGCHVPPADFFIMSTKFTGLGSLPPLICGQETQLYFLPGPGVMALTRDVYRQILYDLLFQRQNSSNFENNDQYDDVELLKAFYQNQQATVIGLGTRIGRFWVPDIQKC